MTAVLTTTVQKKPLVIGQWVRVKRGPLKGSDDNIHNDDE